ncbi:MAG: hypothetical protein KGZ51_03520 [Erysipelothrix sp.]|nr:hypothetical protein [Erysipelothrix sp.]
MAAKKAKGHIPLDILEKRYNKLGRIIKNRRKSDPSQIGSFGQKPRKKSSKK